MASVKLTKNEQKKQKDQLKQFQRYLPTLQLKKQQLQMVIRRIEAEAAELAQQQKAVVESLQSWVAVFNENREFERPVKLEHLVIVDRVIKYKGNIAGVPIPVFKELTFKDIPYDYNVYPLWVDRGISSLKEIARFDAMITTLEKQIELLGRELRVTSQRVNLFEKVKIPQTKENIRKIQIYLGDQQTSAVVRGKISKRKLVKQANQEIA
ncbi:MAG: V-type ATP synthase subunit D [Sphaerochaetaceae bacterium]|nr:V-type ATP synthase subunit D [Sphaerochaetaceae bacterium]